MKIKIKPHQFEYWMNVSGVPTYPIATSANVDGTTRIYKVEKDSELHVKYILMS